MMPYIQLERRRDELSAEELATIKKEQWIDDETARLIQRFPPQLAGFRHWRQDPEVKACCEQAGADDVYQDFIWKLAFLQAQRNYTRSHADEPVHQPERLAGRNAVSSCQGTVRMHRGTVQ